MEKIVFACNKNPTACDYVYKNAHRLAAQWLNEHAPIAKNPVINQIDFKSWRYMDLIMALREAYAAGMIMGACLQADYETGIELGQEEIKYRI